MKGILPAIVFLFLATSPSAAPLVHVPFVGCPADGQTGPQPAPKTRSVAFHLPPESASRLAFYKADYASGVLAPRGWHCIGLYGSNGSFILVTPSNYGFKQHWAGHKINGLGIEYGVSAGGTSGRFEVAAAIERYFPAQRRFFDKLIQGDEPKSSFPAGGYAGDHILFRDNTTIVLETPPAVVGEASHSWLGMSREPARSVIDLTDIGGVDGPDLFEMNIRLAPGDDRLLDSIVGQAFPALPVTKVASGGASEPR